MAADPTPPPPPAPTPKPSKPARSPLGGLVIPLVLIAVAGLVFGVFYFLNAQTPKADESKVLDGYVVGHEKYANLGGEYKDADGDLIADTPADAKAPEVLYFTEIPGPNADADEKKWEAFLKHMTDKTGVPCKYLKKVDVPAAPPEKREGDREEPAPPNEDLGAVKTFDAQLKALHDGQLHVTAFTTGQVRQAVNTAGFRPLVVPADKEGHFHYQVEVLVPANSPAKTVADLKGKTIAVSALSSNSGAKAPFVLFHDEFKLNPRTDYKIKLAGTYWAALGELVTGKADAVCISSDLLARELNYTPTEDEHKRGRVKLTADKYRSIYKSGDYPKLCFGVSYTLPAPLVEKIRDGFKTFPFDGEVGKKYQAEGVTQFRPVDYKADWEAVRKIDDRLADILKPKP